MRKRVGLAVRLVMLLKAIKELEAASDAEWVVVEAGDEM
jgi:hypothetical protein